MCFIVGAYISRSTNKHNDIFQIYHIELDVNAILTFNRIFFGVGLVLLVYIHCLKFFEVYTLLHCSEIQLVNIQDIPMTNNTRSLQFKTILLYHHGHYLCIAVYIY